MYCIKIKNFFQNKMGVITIISAIIFPLIIIFMAIVFEMSNIYLEKERLQAVIDRALLDTVTMIKFGNIEAMVREGEVGTVNTIWIKNLKYELEHSDFSSDVQNVIDDTSMKLESDSHFKTLSITAISQYKMPFKICNIHLLCPKNKYVTVPVLSSMKIGHNAGFYIDLMIVLDVSSSMKQDFMNDQKKTYSRLEVAQKSIRTMLADFRKVPNYANVFRTGSVGFNDKPQLKMPLEGGLKRIYDSVNQYKADGGTNSFEGMKYANEQLYGNTQDTKDRKKVVIFLTDGDNNSAINSIKTIALCNDMKKKKAVIYSIALSLKKKYVVQGCSSSGNVYVADDAQSLMQAYSLIGKDVVKDKNIKYVR
ncbi:VWA domain-containing protein [Candidatus Liberibacter solanacearum]